MDTNGIYYNNVVPVRCINLLRRIYLFILAEQISQLNRQLK